MKKKVSFVLALSTMFLLSSCFSFHIVKGDGNLVTKKIDITDYTKIDASNGSMTINYVQSEGAPGLEVTMDQNIYDMFEFKVEDNELVIRAKNEFRRSNFRPTEFTITTNSRGLEDVDVSGHADFFLKSPLTANDLDFSLSGSGTINLNDTVTVNKLETHISGSATLNTLFVKGQAYKGKISGSGTLNLNGAVENTEFSISGSGDVRAFGCQIANMACRISGSGDVEATVSNSIDVSVSGSGRIKYKGTPATINKSISGSGSVVKVD